MSKTTIFSGIQPSGNLHIGNYLGMIKEAVKLQEQGTLILMIADLHAITVHQDPHKISENITDLAAWLMAAGLDDTRAHLFVQSENHDHTYLSWILSCITQMGELERMTQYKDKAKKQGEKASLGLFSYPVLQTADVLLYDVDIVPVGEDQKQHIELMRDIARKFNNKFGATFKEPKAAIKKDVARIMSLTSPEKKMSKSDENPSGTINLSDTSDVIHKKIARAVTDSSTTVNAQNHGENSKGGVQNLLNLYASLNELSYTESLNHFEGKSYASFKEEVASNITSGLDEIQRNYLELKKSPDRIRDFLNNGRDFTVKKSNEKIIAVKNAVGLGR